MTLELGTNVVLNGHYAGKVIQIHGPHLVVSDGTSTRNASIGLDTITVTARGLTNDELQLLKHISMFGSTGYPVRKFRSGKWTWGPFRSIQGPPTVFKTKREALASFEAFHQVLLDAYAGRL